LNHYFQEIAHIIQTQGLDEGVTLKYIRSLCSIGFKLNNIVTLDQKDFGLFCSFIENYYAIGFHSQLNETLAKLYLEGQDEETVTLAEEILGFGISWIKSLLDNPGIWVSDMLFSDRDSDATGQAE
jgi:hypothetical protein